MSSGYDSSAVAVLARKAGAREAMCIVSDRDGLDDSAERCAQLLGYRLHNLTRDAWQSLNMPEVGCLAGSGGAGEVAMLGDPDLLSGRVLLTGFHGDAAWSLDPGSVSDDWRRKDGSGLCLAEPRLHLGFLHCGVCFWGLDQARDIHAISVSEAMQRWDLGVSYSRPIPRRLVEEAGVPRGWFGVRKRGVSDQLLNLGHSLSPCSEKAFGAWVRRHSMEWLVKGHLPPVGTMRRVGDLWRSRIAVPNLRRAARILAALKVSPIAEFLRRQATGLLTGLHGSRRYYTAWAIEKAVDSYPTD
jgi:hypothetical protein